MAIETFSFPARVNSSADTRYRIRKAQFGDGYTQVAGDGINPVIRSWELNFTGPREFIENVTRFLDVHQGLNHFNGAHHLVLLGFTVVKVINLIP